jgi:hypothetical protein
MNEVERSGRREADRGTLEKSACYTYRDTKSDAGNC